MSDHRQHREYDKRKDSDRDRHYHHHRKHKGKDKRDTDKYERDMDHRAKDKFYHGKKYRYEKNDFCLKSFFIGENSASDCHTSSLHQDTRKYHSSHESKQPNETDQAPSKHCPLVELQFERFRRALNKLFSQFIEDEEDLWNFVKKYEQARKKKLEEEVEKKNRNETEPFYSELDIPLVYDQVHNINIDLNVKDSEMLACLEYYDDNDRRCGMTNALYEEWKLLLRTYLDFKQKEKFATLTKIRETQHSLPVAQYKQEIIDTIKRERIVIIAGDTGCGKSTQIPQYLVQAGYERIACTQPRRIACISLSKRVAYETLSQYSDTVGYQIRFEKHRRVSTKIVFITEGLLLRQVSSDSFLSSYDVLILDEIHERHLHGDFLLGVVKCLLHSSNVEMKIILMSATINIDLFHAYFDRTAKIIKVPGRLYPIQLEYHPVVDAERSKTEKLDPGPYIRILTIIDKKYPRSERGDVLVFMSGISEISSVVRAAQEYNEKVGGWIILSLHSTLSLEEQDKVFHYAPEGHRKLIVSTNIAETSVTIDGIRFVIDSGKVKEMSYDLSLRMSTLQEMWISKANAEQRKGRAGRTGPGICYRLYSESQYASFPDYATPEIRRVSIDSLLLSLVCMGLGNVRKFPFLEPPPPENIEQSVRSLVQHGAIDSSEKATSLGRFLSDLPVDIPLGKILIFGSMFHQIDTILSLTAVLSVQSPFTNRAFRDPDCETARKELESEHGDPLTVLNAYREWLEVKKDRVRSRAWCKRRGIEEQRFYEVTKLRSQFKQVLEDSGLVQSDLTAPDDSMSSRERALRHGEIKLLKALKRKQAEEAPKKRKMLKPDSTYEIEREEDGEEREGENNMDMNEVDFRLKHDPKQVQDLLSMSTARTHKDLIILKVILASGLYPQVAIADEYNTSETVKEPLFHVKDKGFVSLHPFSVFTSRSELLTLKENEIVDPPIGVQLPRHTVLGTNHQLLVYIQPAASPCTPHPSLVFLIN
uniref:Probable ATP-dependent RNA helicase DHX34 n=1 Tax=Cacopsylla melanoneura TaxID=428564 RepID=A0A8D9DVY2_9HEMI